MSSPQLPRVLIVEDDDGIREMVRAVLTGLGFPVQLASSGAQAIEIFQQGRTDVVLLDVKMPIMDGPRTLLALRQSGLPVRCCFMSGYADSHTREQLMGLGATHILAKPFRLEDLRQAILDAYEAR
jgi:CheY-like chemotaxis protein